MPSMHQPLTRAALADLRRPRTYPAVSLLLPTHRREPDNAQDAVRQALDTGARVRFVPDDGLADTGRIAAVLRY